jgi:hypothetical protein
MYDEGHTHTRGRVESWIWVRVVMVVEKELTGGQVANDE